MSPYRAALLALVVIVSTLVTAFPAGATSHGAPGATGAQIDATGDRVDDRDARSATAVNASSNNTSLGADISAFMQSNAAEADGAVETGMWSAAFNGTENQSARVRLVEGRTTELHTRLSTLRERKAELLAEREAGTVNETAYTAKVSRLVGQINALQSAIDATQSRGKEVGANVEELASLQSESKNLSGPEIAAIARNVSGVNVENGERGPPNDVNTGADSANGVGNGKSIGNGNNDATKNGTAGPPDDAGPDNDTTHAGQRGLPSESVNAPVVGNASSPIIGNGGETGTAVEVPNASTPATPPETPPATLSTTPPKAPPQTGNDLNTLPTDDSSSVPVLSTVTTATTDFIDRITHELAS